MQYVLRYDKRIDQWTLQRGIDDAELLAGLSIELISGEPTPS
jgi:hypothetical protein